MSNGGNDDNLKKIYHRIKSPTQTYNDAQKQLASGLLYGKLGKFNAIPKVRAYIGPLRDNSSGIEFTTDVEPDPGSPPGQACWSGRRKGILHIKNDEIVAIKIKILKITKKNEEVKN